MNLLYAFSPTPQIKSSCIYKSESLWEIRCGGSCGHCAQHSQPLILPIQGKLDSFIMPIKLQYSFQTLFLWFLRTCKDCSSKHRTRSAQICCIYTIVQYFPGLLSVWTSGSQILVLSLEIFFFCLSNFDMTVFVLF